MNFVLMADIVGSRKKNGQELMKAFAEMTSLVTVKKRKNFLSPITITLGDEFQCVVKTLRDGVEVVFLMEELIVRKKLNFKLRYVLHYGKIETEINPKTAHGMLGPGLTHARKLLSELKGKGRHRVLISTSNDAGDKLMNDCFFIYTGYVDSWNIGDYETIAMFWDLKDYKKVANKLCKDVSLLWRKEISIFIRQYATIKNVIYNLLP